MGGADLSKTEEALLKWFKQRPNQPIYAAQLEDESDAIWEQAHRDPQRIARSLWEKGWLERAGAKAPYWYVPTADHAQIALRRQKVVFEKAVKSLETRLEVISDYAAMSGSVSDEVRHQINDFCRETRAGMRKLKFIK